MAWLAMPFINCIEFASHYFVKRSLFIMDLHLSMNSYSISAWSS